VQGVDNTNVARHPALALDAVGPADAGGFQHLGAARGSAPLRRTAHACLEAPRRVRGHRRSNPEMGAHVTGVCGVVRLSGNPGSHCVEAGRRFTGAPAVACIT
jgi:hypothetical protein